MPREECITKKKKKKQCISHQNKTPRPKTVFAKEYLKKIEKTTSCKDNHISLKYQSHAHLFPSIKRKAPEIIFDEKKEMCEKL